jgi:two-component system, chemotaxis family, chemotaxis protein CheY
LLDLSLPVLLVDDYASMRRTIRSMLQHIGFTTITEDDGSGALSLIQDLDFGLIVSDLMMTPVSGLEILRKVRGHPRTQATLFVMVTGAAHQDMVLAARGLKVDDYVVKPFDTNTLKRKLFALMERGGVALTPAAETATQPPVPAAAAPANKENAGLAALKRAIEKLYALLDARLRAGDSQPHDDLVSLIRVYIDRAVAQGVEPHYRQQLDAMLANLPTAKPGTGGGLGGHLYRVEKPALRATAIPDRRQNKGALPDERRSGREARRYKRFSDPALHVTIGERSYRTVDWSIGGLAIGGYSGALQPDKQIKVTLRVEGDEEEKKTFADRAVVMRNNPGAGILALRFTSHSSATLKVLEYLTRRQETPVEATRAPAAAPSGP